MLELLSKNQFVCKFASENELITKKESYLCNCFDAEQKAGFPLAPALDDHLIQFSHRFVDLRSFFYTVTNVIGALKVPKNCTAVVTDFSVVSARFFFRRIRQ